MVFQLLGPGHAFRGFFYDGCPESRLGFPDQEPHNRPFVRNPQDSINKFAPSLGFGVPAQYHSDLPFRREDDKLAPILALPRQCSGTPPLNFSRLFQRRIPCVQCSPEGPHYLGLVGDVDGCSKKRL